jgi:phosphoribosylpyrophosphate synthetase
MFTVNQKTGHVQEINPYSEESLTIEKQKELNFIKTVFRELDLTEVTLVPNWKFKVHKFKLQEFSDFINTNTDCVSEISSDYTDKDCVIYENFSLDSQDAYEQAKYLKSQGARNIIYIVFDGRFTKGFEQMFRVINQICTANKNVSLDLDDSDRMLVVDMSTL